VIGHAHFQGVKQRSLRLLFQCRGPAVAELLRRCNPVDGIDKLTI
jgi:hypothetical protein